MHARDDVKRRVQEATDLVQLIGQHVALRARGREFVGLCPFHDDKNPSMNVVPAKQLFKCFACGAGGDCFSFVMDYHKMSFPEALKFLAEKAGIEMPRYGGGDVQGISPRQQVMAANQLALGFFQAVLKDESRGRAAKDYLQQRGISPEMVQTFQIGAAPDEWDGLTRTATAKRWDFGGLEMAGLVAKRSSGDGYYDKLRHRLIFPILDNIGRPIAFGGRILPGTTREDASDAKYINSHEHAAFNKSATLYGIHAAQKPIIDCRTAVIVEGYVDVVACHQNGFRNVVATLGTAMTAQHAQLLRRYCDRVILLFDADEAGQKAADRAVEVFFGETLDVQIVRLPGDKDPADLFARPEGAEIWKSSLDGAVDAIQYQFERLCKRYEGAETMAGKQKLTEEYIQRLVQLGIHKAAPGRRGLILAMVGQLLNLSPGEVQELIRRASPGVSRHSVSADEPAPTAASAHKPLVQAERQLVGAMLSNPELFNAVLSDGRPISECIVATDFQDLGVRAVFHAMSEWLHEHEGLSSSEFREAFADESLLRMALSLQMETDRLADDRTDRLADIAAACAGAILRNHAELQYQQQRVEIDSNQANNQTGEEQAQRRLELAITHAKAHPSARKAPRIVGRD